MRRSVVLSVSSLLFLTPSFANEPIDRKFDTDGNGSISKRELRVLALHIASPTLRKFDKNVDGKIDQSELEGIYADAEKGAGSDAVLALVSKIDSQMISSDGEVPVGEISLPAMDEVDDQIAEIAKQSKSDCDLKNRLFLRKNKLDMSIYNKTVGVKLAEKAGASISFSSDTVADERVLSIDAASAYVLLRDCDARRGANPEDSFPTGWSLALFSDLSGTTNSNDSDAKSTARFGVDGQLEIQGGLVRYQYFTVGPYVQTDFKGDGSAYGLDASWQPLDDRLHLGIAPAAPWLEWYVDAVVRADLMRVNDAGVMGLTDDTSYVWLGADLALTVNLAPSIFERRLFAKAATELYWDGVSKTTASLWSAAVGYNFDPDGNVAIGLEYKYGESRTDLTHVEGVTLELGVKY